MGIPLHEVRIRYSTCKWGRGKTTGSMRQPCCSPAALKLSLPYPRACRTRVLEDRASCEARRQRGRDVAPELETEMEKEKEKEKENSKQQRRCHG